MAPKKGVNYTISRYSIHICTRVGGWISINLSRKSMTYDIVIFDHETLISIMKPSSVGGGFTHPLQVFNVDMFMLFKPLVKAFAKFLDHAKPATKT